MATVSEQWTQLLDRCLQRRVRREQFHSLADQLYRRTPIMSAKLSDMLITRQELTPDMFDPLLSVYVETLLEHGRINSADLLAALYRHSKSAIKPESRDLDSTEKKENKVYNTAEFESAVFDMLTRAYLPDGGRPKTQDETRIALVLLSEWLEANISRGTSLADESDHQVLVEAMSVIESFGALSIAMLENARVAGVIDVMLSRDTKKKLAQGLTSFVQFWATAAPQHAANAARLDSAQKNRGLVEDSETEPQDAALDVATAMQIEAIVDMQMVHTRPHTFVFLNALLTGCPLTDESMMMNYLHTRYGGDAQSLTMDLIFAAFDTLAAAAERSDPHHSMFSLKSFLVNKVPLLLSTLSGSLLAPELVIQQALSHVDINVFPTVGLGMLQSNTALQDTRQDFVYACILHGLLTANSVGRLLGESTFDSPPSPSSRLHKDMLSQQCANEPGKVVQLIADLEKLDGNAGAIIGAVVEAIRTACATKDTMSLKSICNAFAGKPHFLDAMLQFTSPASILQPLCQLLETWKYEDDQGESQPVYDEFASVFLLVLTFVYRYGFSHAEAGMPKEAFVFRYVAQNHQEQLSSQMTEEQSRHLGSWVKGLFDPDGITEEVTASCQPQQFYLLVPTIFSQTILACSAGVLSLDTIKTGLEYLQEPFLLPSLVGAIHWITTYVREYPGVNTDIIIQILQRVTRAPSSGEAQAMHTSIMGIVSLPLVHCLRTLRKINSKRVDVDPMLQSLKQYGDFIRSPFGPCTSIAMYSLPQGVKSAVKSAFQGLINWNLQITTLNPAQLPPPYQHRVMLIAEHLIGATEMLSVLLAEIKEQSENAAGAAAVALDIATAIVCAPKAENSPIEIAWPTSPVPAQHPYQNKRLNLREALSLQNERVADIIKKDQSLAETIVRLHRRVEAQCAIGTAPLPDLTGQLPPQDVQQMLDSITTQQNTTQQQPALDLTQDSGLTADLGLNGADSMQLDFSVGNGGDGGMGGLLGGGESMNPDDDVFGDLDLDLSNMESLDIDYGF
ncbi:uncharacterized protein PV09_03743 [Verruconis gallopava]|uniref:Mediator of RNA polymerase II transcription subunit 5 n=1 Tax=Verruconis gallopava TaxID=253628 RepID=A0A0D2B1I9_9PEZI|nr:uncharacterized protein PV09_03743 [Verruconis gallopava]KIW05199.1 hypothetical protein PV09_03743 [Verruconis gallopava]